MEIDEEDGVNRGWRERERYWRRMEFVDGNDKKKMTIDHRLMISVNKKVDGAVDA